MHGYGGKPAQFCFEGGDYSRTYHIVARALPTWLSHAACNGSSSFKRTLVSSETVAIPNHENNGACLKSNRSLSCRAASVVVLGMAMISAAAADLATSKDPNDSGAKAEGHPAVIHFTPQLHETHGAVDIGGRRIDYNAYAGTLVVHPKGWDDVPQNAPKDENKDPRPEASMFYVAYMRGAAGKPTPGASRDNASGAIESDTQRPVTFLFNGGPGSATVWLHMGAFGPRRVVTLDDSHTPAAPYSIVNNEFSLLDVSDLVFVDAPGTGFSRIAGTDKEKAFYGVDQDAEAFADFIVQFLSKYGRWNSPKYLFGESYGTTRAAVLSNVLQSGRSVDLNGVILLSQILVLDASIDGPQFNPGIDLAYEVALPSYAATAWYHHRLQGQPGELEPLLTEVEHFALGDYARALNAGSTLPTEQRAAIASKLHDFTGLPQDYILKSDLRVNGGQFEKTLEGDADITVGRFDSRFQGPTMDPLSREADYDPQSAAIRSAYVSGFNEYVRKTLGYGGDQIFKPSIGAGRIWNLSHQPPGADTPIPQSTNVTLDLATAMKYNPQLHVLLTGGYYDLATPFFAGMYEMQHLPIPDSLRGNIEYAYFPSGHMVYAHKDSHRDLHNKVADFIRRTSTAH
jgi:carboxypeptidase C (cathepsin A)